MPCRPEKRFDIGEEAALYPIRLGASPLSSCPRSLRRLAWSSFWPSILTAPSVVALIRDAGINIVALHQHMSQEEPRIMLLHYWGKGQARPGGHRPLKQVTEIGQLCQRDSITRPRTITAHAPATSKACPIRSRSASVRASKSMKRPRA